MFRDEYTYAVDLIKSSIKSQKLRKAILRLIAQSEYEDMTVCLWFPYDENIILEEDNWEDWLHIDFVPLNKGIDIEGYYTRLVRLGYGYENYQYVGEEPWSRQNWVWSRDGNIPAKIEIWHIEDELKEDYAKLWQELVDDVSEGYLTLENPKVSDYVSQLESVFS